MSLLCSRSYWGFELLEYVFPEPLYKCLSILTIEYFYDRAQSCNVFFPHPTKKSWTIFKQLLSGEVGKWFNSFSHLTT